jgi:hypothetical protein
MSFKDTIMSGINSTINNYISIISKKYNIKENELYELWSGGNSQNIQQTTSQNQELEKLSKTELIEMCKSKKLKVSGSKNDLISRIVLNETQNKEPIKQETQTVIKKLVEKIPKLEIKKNAFGNFEHKDTTFVFDSKTQKVYGKQNENGTIEELSSDDIETCNKYKFSYIIPNNLDKKINILDVKVNELDDDVDDVEEELDEEEYEYEDEIEEEEEEFYEE